MSQNRQNTAWQDESPERGPEIGYIRQWRAFALRRNTALFLLYGWIPVCIGLFYLSASYLHVPVTRLVTMVIWLGCVLASVWWAGEFRCPRCRRRYGALGHRNGDTNFTRGIFDKVCANCKLTKFEKC